MVLDIIIVLILLSTAIYGFRKGFVYTLIHAVGWVGAIVLAYFATPFTSSFLKENTGLYNWVHGLLNTRFDASLDTVEASMKSLPEVISQSVNNFSTNIVDGVTGTFTNIVYTVLVFVLLFFLFKVILWLILRLFSKDYHGGFTNFFDGLFGTIFGLIKGGVLVIVFITLLLPIANSFSVGLTETITDQLNHSYIAGEIYNNNLLLVMLQSFFS